MLICMNGLSLFSEKNNKNTISLSFAELAQRLVKIKCFLSTTYYITGDLIKSLVFLDQHKINTDVKTNDRSRNPASLAFFLTTLL